MRLIYAIWPAFVTARPAQINGEPYPNSLAGNLRNCADFAIGMILGASLQTGICIIVAWGNKKLQSSQERQINRVQSYGLTSLLAASAALYVLQQSHELQNTAFSPVVLGGTMIFWFTSHIMFWMQNFRLYQKLASWHLLMPWLLGGTGVMLCLLSESADKAAWSVCMFWLPILTWPLVAQTLILAVQFLELFGSHLFAFRETTYAES